MVSGRNDEQETPVLRPVVWLGNSKRNMRNKKHDRKEPEFEEGSGNVFADLDLDDSDELFARAKIGFHVYQVLKKKALPGISWVPLEL